MNEIQIKPFLRWAGGKRWLTPLLEHYVPKDFNDYYEPFVGSGAIFFRLNPINKSFLSDTNPNLINTYTQIKENVESVIEALSCLNNTEKEYYEIRSKVFSDPVEKAAQFIYLNKTSYNGIYRVNKSGGYNVPYGYRKKVVIADIENLKKVNEILQNVRLDVTDFESALKNVKEKDFVFLDPPYTVAHENNGFIHYNQKLFSWEDQERLAHIIENLCKKNVYFMLTNAVHRNVRALFGKIVKPLKVQRASTVGGLGANRSSVNEYIFTNCK